MYVIEQVVIYFQFKKIYFNYYHGQNKTSCNIKLY